MPLICSRRNCDNVAVKGDRNNYCEEHIAERTEYQNKYNYEHREKISRQSQQRITLLRMFAKKYQDLFDEFKNESELF